MIVATPGGNQQVLGTAQTVSYAPFSTLLSNTYTGRSVTPESALAITALYSAVSLIAKAAGTMPLRTFDRGSGYPVEVLGGQMAPMLREAPNAEISAAVMWTMIFSHLLLRGNAYLAKRKDPKTGRVIEVAPIPPDLVAPFRDDNRKKWFRVQVRNPTNDLRPSFMYFDASDICHIIGPSATGDGIMGDSPVSVNRQRLAVALSASEFEQRLYKQGTMQSGVLVQGTGAPLKSQRKQELSSEWRANYSGAENAHGVIILEQGWDYKPLSLAPKDLEFIQQQQHSVSEIAAMYSLPAEILNGNGPTLTYNNGETHDLRIAKWAIRPWLTYAESALKMDPDFYGPLSSWYPSFDMKELLRADAKTRAEIAEMRLKGRSVTPNEIRAEEGGTPRTDEYGDKFNDELWASGIPTNGAVAGGTGLALIADGGKVQDDA